MKGLIIAVLGSSALIIVATGHGVAINFLVAVMAVGSLFHPYGESISGLILAQGIVTMIGYVCLIIALIFEEERAILTPVGVFLLLVGFVVLLVFLAGESTVKITVFSGLPFLVLSMILFVYSITQLTATAEDAEV